MISEYPNAASLKTLLCDFKVFKISIYFTINTLTSMLKGFVFATTYCDF